MARCATRLKHDRARVNVQEKAPQKKILDGQHHQSSSLLQGGKGWAREVLILPELDKNLCVLLGGSV